MKKLLVGLLLMSGPAVAEETRVTIVGNGSIYFVTVKVNDTEKMNFMIDSGATWVMLTPEVFARLKPTVTGHRTTQVGDGTTHPVDIFNIPSMQIGDVRITDVGGAIIHDTTFPKLILGQSFLSRLKSWSINNTWPASLVITSMPPLKVDIPQAQLKPFDPNPSWSLCPSTSCSTVPRSH